MPLRILLVHSYRNFFPIPLQGFSMTFKTSSLITMILAGVSLTACGSMPTQWMPNGYRYHDDTPLSSPAPSRPWLKDVENPSLNDIGDNVAAWQGAVYELINPIPAIVPPSAGAVSLKAVPPHFAATSAFDHYLRQGLLSYGYTVNPGPGGVFVMNYKALPLDSDANLKIARNKLGKEFVTKADQAKDTYFLTLDVTDAKGKIISQQSTIAVLPHEKKEYMRAPGLSYQPTQGEAYKRKAVYDTRD